MELLKMEPKKLNWKLERTNSIYRIFEEEKNQKMEIPYGLIMGFLSKISESVPCEKNNFYGWAWTDDNGEIQFEIPPIEDFENQFRGFLKNEYAKSANYPLALFFKSYGSWEIVQEKIPIKIKPQIKKTRIKIQCPDCGKAHYSDENCQSI
jgi:hypothetical protein